MIASNKSFIERGKTNDVIISWDCTPKTLQYNDNIVDVSDKNSYLIQIDNDTTIIMSNGDSLFIKSYYPIYYSSSFTRDTNAQNILSGNKTVSSSSNGDYRFIIDDDKYLFMALPSNIDMNYAELNGIEIIFNAPDKYLVNNVEYQVYTTQRKLKPGDYTIHICQQ